MAFTPFPPRQPTASARLPLTLMTLDDWALATITGADSEKGSTISAAKENMDD